MITISDDEGMWSTGSQVIHVCVNHVDHLTRWRCRQTVIMARVHDRDPFPACVRIRVVRSKGTRQLWEFPQRCLNFSDTLYWHTVGVTWHRSEFTKQQSPPPPPFSPSLPCLCPFDQTTNKHTNNNNKQTTTTTTTKTDNTFDKQLCMRNIFMSPGFWKTHNAGISQILSIPNSSSFVP